MELMSKINSLDNKLFHPVDDFNDDLNAAKTRWLQFVIKPRLK